MTYYHWIVLAGFGIFLFIAGYLLAKVILTKEPEDPAPENGNILSAQLYSFTGAMSPLKKESAYLHLPTYTAGMIYHLGTFLSFFLLISFFFDIKLFNWLKLGSQIFLAVSGLCGIGILVKRMVLKKLRNFSSPDDYFSNILVTGFHFITMLVLLKSTFLPLLFIYCAVLLIYMPVGKLRHAVYFFTTRLKLGKYYGKRGVWPVKKPLS